MTNRMLFDVALKPAVGTRFQPTGFPDLGSAQFDRPTISASGVPGWEKALLVESAQSMANRLEGTAWDSGIDMPRSIFDGLPYVRVVHADTGEYLTSSRTEAHRLASAFIKDANEGATSMVQVIASRLGLADDRPIAPRQIAEAVLALDPFCLIHGVFFADKAWQGQPKISRAITGFVEAIDVRPADSGGVKKDHVRHSLGDQSGGGTAEGYGTVPFHRLEWTAREITASFAIDRRQLVSYGLGEDVTDLLEATALWEIRTLMEDGLRLRTACDLLPVQDLDAIGLPPMAELESRIATGVAAARQRLGSGGPLEVQWAGGKKKAKS